MNKRTLRRLAIAPVAPLIVLASLPFVGSAAAATPIPPSVQAAIDDAESKPAYTHSTWGLSVVDRDTGEMLIRERGQKLFVPGSMMKTFTTAAALANYGPGYRFRTPVYRTGGVRNGNLHGNLVMVASGDFSFGLREQPGGQLGYNSTPQIDHNYADTGLPGPTLLANSHPLGGVKDLASQVREAGIRRVGGNVVIDDRLFDSFTGWPDGKISPIWVNENVIDMRAKPTEVGEPADVYWRPKTPALRVVNSVTTGPAGSQPSLEVVGPTHGKIKLRGSIPSDSNPILNIAQIPHPSSFARTAFIQALQQEGVSVAASKTGANPSGSLPKQHSLRAGKRVALRVSDPLSQYIRVILKVSYNRGADLMACLIAVKAGSKDCEDGLGSIVDNNTALGVSPLTTFPFDGAGSDDRDRTSPIAATTFLSNVRAESYGQAFYHGLSILGVDGTLAETGKDSAAKGKIRAKDGARAGFVGNHGFAGTRARMGYMKTAGGRQLVFAHMVNNVPLSQPTDIFNIDTDLTAVETAIQQGY